MIFILGLSLSIQVREGEVMAMVNKYGQEYLCFLPAVVPLHSEYKHDDDILDQLVDISGEFCCLLRISKISC